MFARLQELMTLRFSLLMSGQHEALSREYLYPYPLYLAGRQHVMRSAEEMALALRRLQHLGEKGGVARIEPMVQAMELPREGRFRVWISYRNLDARGLVLSTGSFIHYCRLVDGEIKTEMSDYAACRSDWLTTEPRRIRA